ncbi:hypothetical protein AAHA92_22995 [Salvia divinorum]|uniref:Uncharacterized protein n=1 Tax=Salvia divinorum TaxID=28513 RepID=A0ABD1GTD3_SALDI
MFQDWAKWVFWMTGNYGSHTDSHYDPNALLEIKGINYRDVEEENVKVALGWRDPLAGTCMSNGTIGWRRRPRSICGRAVRSRGS